MAKGYRFGRNSTQKLQTLHPKLQRILNKAIKRTPVDFTIVHGYRGEALQNRLHAEGAGLPWPKSRHNSSRDPKLKGRQASITSDAVDFAPWVDGGIPWDDTHMFGVIYGVLAACAAEEGVILRWGSDWDGDGSTQDHKFLDFGHVEIDW